MQLLVIKGLFRGLISIVGLTIYLSTTLVYAVPKIKNHDQTMTIETNEQGCVTQVKLKSPIDNCQGSEFNNRCGRSGKDCVCILDSKFLSWEIDNNARFELQFIGANPLKSNCKLKSGSNKKIKCKVESSDGEYEYNVAAESCPGNTYDPQIIVRH